MCFYRVLYLMDGTRVLFKRVEIMAAGAKQGEGSRC